MKAISAVAIFGLQVSLAATSLQFCAAQNPLAALENEAKEKAAEVALTKVLNDNLPLTLDAKDVYPTVTTLPGGPFSPTPLKLTADQLDQPLPPGDYTINTLDFCSQYSIHEPGAGLAYVLGPYEGKAAGAIGALIWRGTEQYGINPNSLQAVSWTIQSGLTYDQMPKSYQAIVDQVIPDYKSEITGDFVTNLESTYNSLAKAASLPPLDTILAKLGAPGQLALDAERQRQILTAQNTNDQIKEQTLFQGQESGIYTPVKAETGPWTERVAGQVYMKLLIAGGNMATNNVMQIRVMPSPTANARVEVGGPRRDSGAPRLVQASYGGAQVTPAMDNAPITLTSIMEGLLGYAVGQGAQALGQVPALVLKALPQLNPFAVTPAEAAEGPAPTTPASRPPASSGNTNSAAQSAKAPGSNFLFASCSGAISSKQLSDAYQSLDLDSQLFQARMSKIKNSVVVLVVDGVSSLGASYQALANCGYKNLIKTHPNTKFSFPPTGDYAFTYIPSGQTGGTIKVLLSAQNLLYNEYTYDYNPAPFGTEADDCGTTTNPKLLPVYLEQVMAYELGQNADGLSRSANYPEEPDEPDTNTIMGQLAQTMKKNPKFANVQFIPSKAIDQSTPDCKIMSGTAKYVQDRADAFNLQQKGGIFDFSLQGQIVAGAQDPANPDVYDGTGKVVDQLDCSSPSIQAPSQICPVN